MPVLISTDFQFTNKNLCFIVSVTYKENQIITFKVFMHHHVYFRFYQDFINA